MSYATIINPAGSAVPTFTRDTEWVRNPFWEPIAHPADERARALYQVDNATNKLALTVTGGNFTVDWGDGSAPEDFTAGALAEHSYDYADADLVGTEAPCTVASDVITHSNHGLNNGDPQSVYAVGGGSVVLTGYVVNATANTFQLSLTLGGSPETIADGSYQLLSYRQAVVEIYPQAGHFIGVLDFNQEPVGITSGHNNKLLELKAHIPNATDMPKLGYSTGNVARCLNLQNLVITGTDSVQRISPFLNFHNLSSLVSASIEMASQTDLRSYFSGCTSLRLVSIDTSGGVNLNSMFLNCSSLRSVQLDTSSGSDFSSMFQGCSSIETVDVNTSGGITLTNMFHTSGISGNVVLDVSSATSIQSMFYGATNLKNLTLLNISAPTALGLCYNCPSLVNFTGDLSDCVNLENVFYNCSSLRSISSWDFSAATVLRGAFYNCDSLVGDITIDAPLVANLARMFTLCSGIGSVTINSPNAISYSEAFESSSVTHLDINFADGCDCYQLANSATSLVSVNLNSCKPGSMQDAFRTCSNLSASPTVDFSLSSSQSLIYAYSGVSTVFMNQASGSLQETFRNNANLLSVEITDASAVSSMENAFVSSANVNSVILGGVLVDVSLGGLKLGYAALVALFTSLGDVTSIGPKTVTVTGNPGAASLTAPDLAIATSKGWTVVT